MNKPGEHTILVSGRFIHFYHIQKAERTGMESSPPFPLIKKKENPLFIFV